jgi:dolichol-phosphate mannosyltransferase
MLRRLGGRAAVACAARFWTVGATGVVVNQVVLVGLLHVTGMHYLLAAVIATHVAIASNFALTEAWVFSDRGTRDGAARRAWQFWLVNSAALVVHGPLLVMLTDGAGLPAATSNLLVLGVLAIARFAVSDRVIWALRPDRDVPTQARSTEVGA